VSKATKSHCTGTVQSKGGRVGNVKQVGFETETGRQLRKVRKWQDQADCSICEQNQPEKLSHRW